MTTLEGPILSTTVSIVPALTNRDPEPLKRTLKELTAETEDLACKYAILNEFHKVKREHKDMRQRYEKMQAAVLRLENQE